MKKDEYRQIMEDTEFGYLADDNEPYYCPTDIEGITEEDLSQDARRCSTFCCNCWRYVLDNKKWEE